MILIGEFIYIKSSDKIARKLTLVYKMTSVFLPLILNIVQELTLNEIEKIFSASS